VQLLAERKALNTGYGRAVLAVLLFQDLVAVPAIALMPLLAAHEALAWRAVGWAIVQVVGAIALVIFFGRYLTRPLFRFVAGVRSQEAFTAATLLVVLGTAFVTALAGLSLAFGAFLAGVLLAESEFRHEIEAAIEPFKGLLLGLFFLAVGLTVDWPFVAHETRDVAIGVVGLLLAKLVLLYLIGRRLARLDHAESLRVAAAIAQGGEFAFVLLALAAREGLMTQDARDLLTVVVVISMALTPLLLLGVEAWIARAAPPAAPQFDEIPDGHRPRVIIAGFGRFGQIVARVLRAQRIPFVALEQDVEQVEASRRFGNAIYYGDPTRPDTLRAAGAPFAELFVLATDDPDANVRTARLVRRLHPHLKIYARARNRQHAFRLMDMNVDYVVRETLHSSLELAQNVLEGLGLSPAQAAVRVERFRQHDAQLLAAQHLVYDDEAKLVQSAQEALADLEQLFAADETEKVE
jgi:glutathione-regulated potassium-efflux system protein KefB